MHRWRFSRFTHCLIRLTCGQAFCSESSAVAIFPLTIMVFMPLNTTSSTFRLSHIIAYLILYFPTPPSLGIRKLQVGYAMVRSEPKRPVRPSSGLDGTDCGRPMTPGTDGYQSVCLKICLGRTGGDYRCLRWIHVN